MRCATAFASSRSHIPAPAIGAVRRDWNWSGRGTSVMTLTFVPSRLAPPRPWLRGSVTVKTPCRDSVMRSDTEAGDHRDDLILVDRPGLPHADLPAAPECADA